MDELLRKAYELLMYAEPTLEGDPKYQQKWMDECDAWFEAVDRLPGHIRGPTSRDANGHEQR